MCPLPFCFVMFLTLLALGNGSRMKMQEAGQGAHCSATTCSTFDNNAKCSCVSFLGNGPSQTELENRAKAILADMLQTQRYLTDYLTADSNFIVKFWRGRRLGSSKDTLAFLEGSLEHLPSLSRVIHEIPVKYLSRRNEFLLPAGSMPIMAEIWHDTRSMFGNTFLGEAGIPLVSGTSTFALEANVNRGKSPVQGSIRVSLNVSRTKPIDCTASNPYGLKCQKIRAKIRCLSAAGLRSGLNPYCKIRVKEDGLTRAHKDKTKVRQSSSDPTFEAMDVEYVWEVPLISSLRGGIVEEEKSQTVPWTLDELTIAEQIHLNIYYLARHIFMDEKKCSSRKFSLGCKLVQKLGTMSIDRETLAEVAAFDTKNTELVDAANKAESVLIGQGSFVQQDGGQIVWRSSNESSFFATALMEVDIGHQMGNPIFIAAHMNARRRRGDHGYHVGGGAGVAMPMIICCIIFLGILTVILA